MTNRIRQARLRKGLTQLKLALLAGIGRSTVSNMETGRYIPRVDDAIRVARALQMPVEALFLLEDAAKKGGDHGR